MLLVCILSVLSSAVTPAKSREFVKRCSRSPCEMLEPGDGETVT